jgi:insertion element IS1 protein InsB
MLLSPFNIGTISRDVRGSYAREVPQNKPLTSKIFTQRIEHNLTLRTRIKRLSRKIICFSQPAELHE